jgi:hypothetical protein
MLNVVMTTLEEELQARSVIDSYRTVSKIVSTLECSVAEQPNSDCFYA